MAWFTMNPQAAAAQATAEDELKMIVRKPAAEVIYRIQGPLQSIVDPTLFSSQRDFRVETDNVVLDRSTGLLWQQRDDGTMRTWAEAEHYCSSLTTAGRTDWRVPSREELLSLIDLSRQRPSIDTAYFPDTQNFNYWASTTYTGTTEHAWTVLFAEGNVYCFRKILHSYVRCVSGGPTPVLSTRFHNPSWDTVLDDGTRLMWQARGNAEYYTQPAARRYCASLTAGGHNDWRLPEIKELASIVDPGSYNPSSFPYFQTERFSYWSDTPFVEESGPADNFSWALNFSDGHMHPYRHDSGYHARCVRNTEEGI